MEPLAGADPGSVAGGGAAPAPAEGQCLLTWCWVALSQCKTLVHVAGEADLTGRSNIHTMSWERLKAGPVSHGSTSPAAAATVMGSSTVQHNGTILSSVEM